MRLFTPSCSSYSPTPQYYPRGAIARKKIKELVQRDGAAEMMPK
jgi:hypothetical protein